MADSPKTFTVESLTELIRQDLDAAFDAVNALPKEEADMLLLAIPRDAYGKMFGRAMVENLRNASKKAAESQE